MYQKKWKETSRGEYVYVGPDKRNRKSKHHDSQVSIHESHMAEAAHPLL